MGYSNLSIEEKKLYHKNYDIAYRKKYKKSIYKRERRWFKKNKSKVNEWFSKYYNNPINKQKRNARNKVNRAIAKGLLNRLPCEICGELKSQAHHNDYNKPLEINWLCSSCHAELHKKIRAIK